MTAISEIRRLFEGARLYVNGSEPNIIPQGGLTLTPECLQRARDWQKRNGDFQEESVIEDFEVEIAKWSGHEKAVSFNSGRAALYAGLKALGMGSGDKVLVPGYTCVAVANSIWFADANPIFYDIDISDYGPDLQSLKTQFEKYPKAKAVILQHTFGIPGGQFKQALGWARDNNLFVIEDCAHALGSTIDNQPVGSFGDVAFFSSERSKCISTFQGGWACTNDKGLESKLRALQQEVGFPPENVIRQNLTQFIFTYLTERDAHRWYKRPLHLWQNQGQYVPGVSEDELKSSKPEHFIHRMPAPMADLGLCQIPRLEWAKTIRKRRADEWKSWAMEKGFEVPRIPDNSDPSYLMYPVLVPPDKKRDLSWSNYLRAEVGRWYTSHLHPSDFKVEGCPQADRAVACCINLPTNLATIE